MDDYFCPYCTLQTQPKDQFCPTCARPLWEKAPPQGKNLSHIGTALMLQVASAILIFVGLIFLLTYLTVKLQVQDPMALARMYLGSDAMPAEVAQTAFELVPRWTLFFLLSVSLYSLVVAAGLYLRWSPISYLFLVSGITSVAACGLITNMLWDVGLAAGHEITLIVRAALSVVDLCLVLVVVGLMLEMRADLFWQKRRILFRLDTDVDGGWGLLVRGRDYGKRSMWGLAALHLRRAAKYIPDEIEVYLAQAVAYIHLLRHEQAAEALAEARRIDPESTQIAELSALLEQHRKE